MSKNIIMAAAQNKKGIKFKTVYLGRFIHPSSWQSSGTILKWYTIFQSDLVNCSGEIPCAVISWGSKGQSLYLTKQPWQTLTNFTRQTQDLHGGMSNPETVEFSNFSKEAYMYYVNMNIKIYIYMYKIQIKIRYIWIYNNIHILYTWTCIQ